MGILTGETTPHWAYFIAIERDLTELSRYIEFHEKNFHCFSIEIAKLLLSASAEVEVVCKQLCDKLNRTPSKKGMKGYRNEIVDAYSEIFEFKVFIARSGLVLTPWTNWQTEDRAPHWWDAYDKVKHHRHTDYGHANLGNALNAVAGLFVLVLHLYTDQARIGALTPIAQLLTTEEAGFGIQGTWYGIPTAEQPKTAKPDVNSGQ